MSALDADIAGTPTESDWVRTFRTGMLRHPKLHC